MPNVVKLRNLVKELQDWKKKEVRTFNRVVSTLKVLGVGNKRYAQLAQQMIKGKIEPIDEVADLIETLHDIKAGERKIERKIVKELKEWKVWNEYLSKVKGCGSTIAATLISKIYPISRFPKPSKLVAYCGVSPVYFKLKCEKGHKVITTSPREKCPVRVGNNGKPCDARILEVQKINRPVRKAEAKGYVFMICEELRPVLHQLAETFEKQGGYYRWLYDRAKQYYTQRDGDKIPKWRIRLRTLAWLKRIFLHHLWEAWRRLEGLPITEPYPVAKLGHEKIIVMVDYASNHFPRFVSSKNDGEL